MLFRHPVVGSMLLAAAVTVPFLAWFVVAGVSPPHLAIVFIPAWICASAIGIVVIRRTQP